MAKSVIANSNSPLLQLPRELRDEIYAYVFSPPPRLYYGLPRDGNTRPRKVKLFTTPDAAAIFSSSSLFPGCNPADAKPYIYCDEATLQHTCRQLRQETLVSLVNRRVRITFHSSLYNYGARGHLTAGHIYLNFMKHDFHQLPIQAYCFDLYLKKTRCCLYYPFTNPGQYFCSLIEYCHLLPGMEFNIYLDSDQPMQLCRQLGALTLALRGIKVTSILSTRYEYYYKGFRKFVSERSLEWRNVANLRIWPIIMWNELGYKDQGQKLFHDDKPALAQLQKWCEEAGASFNLSVPTSSPGACCFQSRQPSGPISQPRQLHCHYLLFGTPGQRATSSMKLNIVVLAVLTASSVATEVTNIPFSTLHRTYSAFQAVAQRGLHDSRSKVARFFDEPASREDWIKYTTKGGALMCGLEGSDQTAGRLLRDTRDPLSAASRFQGDLQTELHNWYWRSVNPATWSCNFIKDWQLSEALHGLGLDGYSKAHGGDNECFRIEHWDPNKSDENDNTIPAILQWYTVPGNSKSYQATKAHYEFGINTKGGAIYGLFLESPQSSAFSCWGRKARTDQLPELRAFSDVIWGYWNRNNPDIKNIRFFLMIGISNDATTELITSCLINKRAELSVWPGTEFSTATDEGQALLGSPNGAAFAFFLMQHKAQLGQKTITKITVFVPGDGSISDFIDPPSLVFHVEDGPQLPPDDGAPDDGAMAASADKKEVVRVHEVYMDDQNTRMRSP
ncbi:cytochrome p450 [Pyrenophora seminiperda CCB06]|uniref:Cytochrome p450 n=1 Tax=Pyrenophora seminiperda CCB06 TaxID=1302712 RepID=A0A3M7M229_9PLEO|nr:cytochrome p450 [Pyrenophora seminiperda CCB06]